MGLLDGEIAIVTGAGTGIGAATAVRFVKEGASVVLVGRRRDKLEETARATGRPDRATVVPGDVRDQKTVDAAIAAATKLGGLHIVVSNAAVAYPVDFPDADFETWRDIFDIIVVGAFRFCREAAKVMIANKTAGRLVNVTSIHGTQAEPQASGYGAAKAAVNQFSRALSVELAPHNIRVNAVAPGFVSTPMSFYNGVNELQSDWFKRFYIEARKIPMARAGRSEEIASAILFLASKESSYVTGHVMVVDGGLTVTF